MNVAELQLQKHLRAHAYSVTGARKVVFAALQQREAQSMAELVTACADKLDRATVYRTISLFEELAVVERLQFGWKYKLELTDQFSDHHHHLTCLRCGKITTMSEDKLLEDRLGALAQAHKFQLQSHQIEIRGLCQSCQAIK